MEDDLKTKQTKLDELNQTKSQMIWLLKEVILAGKKNKKSVSSTASASNAGGVSSSVATGTSSGLGSSASDANNK